MRGFFRFVFRVSIYWLISVSGRQEYCQAQYPSYFSITDKDGLPSNEVYSIFQDREGLVWLAGDAGLYKYDGIRFRQYTASSQGSRALSGLCQSISGRVYVYSFKGQVFCTQGDSLAELKHNLGIINGMVCDKSGNVWLSHENGITAYNEAKKIWTNYRDLYTDGHSDLPPRSSSVVNSETGGVSFVAAPGIVSLGTGGPEIIQFRFDKRITAGNYLLSNGSNSWLLTRSGELCFRRYAGKYEPFTSTNLSAILKGRKLTNVKELDGKLWICSYDGLIIYDPETDLVKHLYPGIAFSSCIKDRENAYWLSTLQKGIMRIPNMDVKVWNKENGGLVHEMLYKICRGGSKVYFGTINGYIGSVKTAADTIQLLSSGVKGDIQQLYYDEEQTALFFSISATLYRFDEYGMSKVNNDFRPVKAMMRVRNGYLLATSSGTYLYTSLAKGPETVISNDWGRTIAYDKQKQIAWVGGNNGLLKFGYKNGKWDLSRKFLDKVQVISSTQDPETGLLYFATFDGKIYLAENNELSLLSALPSSVQLNQIVYHSGKLYCATNSGPWALELNDRKWVDVSHISGMGLGNVPALSIDGGSIWLATSMGLYRVPVSISSMPVKGRVFLRKMLVNGKSVKVPELNYDQSLSFFVEASNYSSNGRHQYAYRIRQVDTGWTSVPGTLEKIDLLKLPTGELDIDIKLIDVSGRDSENTVSVRVYVHPPFWQSWWFFLLIFILLSSLAFLIFRFQLARYKRKQAEIVSRMQLENQLELSQQTALKAQMNPHFIFNVLNSIKSYIYENDKKAAAEYLGKFASLVREILNTSSQARVRLSEEIRALELYIQLEGILLQPPFSYQIKLAGDLDTETLLIPGLIIQPFVENAFKHGLQHKHGTKLLSLEFSLDDEHRNLIVTITDNGIGRQASAEIRKADSRPHTPFATEANSTRLALLNKDKEKVSIIFEDRYDEAGLAAGTVVGLTIEL
jgi:ligand-binding sensor domain-containing protein/two-component sensor histidine kinase